MRGKRGAPYGNCNAAKNKSACIVSAERKYPKILPKTGHRPWKYKGRVSSGALSYLNKISKATHYRAYGWYFPHKVINLTRSVDVY